MVPPINTRIEVMGKIYEIWVNKRGNDMPHITKCIETIENRIALHVYNNNLNNTEYANMIYRICLFLINSDHYNRHLREEPNIEIIIEEIKTMNIQNMTKLDEQAFETELVELEMRKQDIVSSEISNAFTCRYCHKNETTYYILQSRASDEGKTVYYKCINCKNYGKVQT